MDRFDIEAKKLAVPDSNGLGFVREYACASWGRSISLEFHADGVAYGLRLAGKEIAGLKSELADYQHLNADYYADKKVIEGLRAELAASEAKVKELEAMSPSEVFRAEVTKIIDKLMTEQQRMLFVCQEAGIEKKYLQYKLLSIDDGLASCMEDLGIERQLRKEAEAKLLASQQDRNIFRDELADSESKLAEAQRELAVALKSWADSSDRADALAADRKTLEKTNAELVNKLADLRAQNERSAKAIKAHVSKMMEWGKPEYWYTDLEKALTPPSPEPGPTTCQICKVTAPYHSEGCPGCRSVPPAGEPKEKI